MIEVIELVVGQEQEFSLTYNDIEYDFSLFWNDFQSYWIMDVKSNDVDIITGVPMKVGIDALSGFEYLGIGKFLFVDTTPLSTIELDPVQDIGDRLKLVRITE